MMAIPERKMALGAPRRDLDWADLHFFLAVAEGGSLSKAAKRLRTTQPTVSKRLDELEHRLGVKLALRSKAGITLTEKGRFVAQQVEAMGRSVDLITHEVAMLDAAPEGEVCIVCPDALATYFLAPALVDLNRAHPGIRLEVHARADELARPDITVQFHETKRMDDVAIPLGWVHHGVFASQDYLDLYGTPKVVTDAFQHRMLMHVGYVSQTERWRPKQNDIQKILDFSLRTDCGPFLVSATASGGGIASMPTYVANVDPRLIMLEPLGELARVRFWLVYDRVRGELPRVRETISWLKRVFEPRANPWFRKELILPSEFLGQNQSARS